MLFYFTALTIFAATSSWKLGAAGIAGAGVAAFLGYQLFEHVRIRAKPAKPMGRCETG